MSASFDLSGDRAAVSAELAADLVAVQSSLNPYLNLIPFALGEVRIVHWAVSFLDSTSRKVSPARILTFLTLTKMVHFVFNLAK